MGVEERMKDFQAGFIQAGGEAAEAREQAPQFAAASLAGDTEAALADPVVGAYVRAVVEAFPYPLDASQVRLPRASENGWRAARLWLLGEGLAQETKRGVTLTERGYGWLCIDDQGLAQVEAAAEPDTPARRAAETRRSYSAARRLGNELADCVDASGLKGFRPKLEAFWMAMTQTLGLGGLDELRRALVSEPSRREDGPWHEH
ncbi:MAG: hypothetical protein ACLFTX_09320 [Thiohalospira sp.]